MRLSNLKNPYLTNSYLLFVDRKLQVAAAKWQTIQEAAPALSRHGQRLQILGTQLTQLVVSFMQMFRQKLH